METGVSFATLKPGAEGRPALPVAGAGIAGLLAVRSHIPRPAAGITRAASPACMWLSCGMTARLAATLQMTQLIPAEDTSSAGLAAGAAICGALMAWNIKRAIATSMPQMPAQPRFRIARCQAQHLPVFSIL